MVYNKGMNTGMDKNKVKDKLSCPICGKVFKNLAGLKGHIAVLHEGKGHNRRLIKEPSTREILVYIANLDYTHLLLNLRLEGYSQKRAEAWIARVCPVLSILRGSPGRNEIGKGGLLNADSPVAFTRQGEVGGTEPPPTTHTTHGLPRQENGRRGGVVARDIEWCQGRK